MHWESHQFGLPKLKDKAEWKLVFLTSENKEEAVISKENTIVLQGRSIALFIKQPLQDVDIEDIEVEVQEKDA